MRDMLRRRQAVILWCPMDALALPAEIEAKFSPVDPDALRRRLTDVGAVQKHPARLMRRVLFGRRANAGIHGDYARVRDEGDTVRISVKVHAEHTGSIADQREIDIETTDFDRAVTLLKAMGLIATAYQENEREAWKLDQTDIVIDTWPGLEPYAEVEAPTEEALERVARLLGLAWEQRRVGSVVEIYMDAYALDRETVLERLKHCTFEENPFSNTKR